MSLSKAQRRKLGAGAAILLVVLLPLWGELREPGHVVWNTFLVLILLSLLVGTFFLQRYLVNHLDEVGEARFDTTNKSGDNG